MKFSCENHAEMEKYVALHGVLSVCSLILTYLDNVMPSGAPYTCGKMTVWMVLKGSRMRHPQIWLIGILTLLS